MGDTEQNGKEFDKIQRNEQRLVEFEKLEQRLQKAVLDLSSRLDVLEDRADQLRGRFELTPLENLKGKGVTRTVAVCALTLLGGFFFFEAILLIVFFGRSGFWSQSPALDRIITVYRGYATIAPPEWPGSSLVWAAGLGFVALVLALGGVALGAIITLSRIGRHSE